MADTVMRHTTATLGMQPRKVFVAAVENVGHFPGIICREMHANKGFHFVDAKINQIVVNKKKVICLATRCDSGTPQGLIHF